MYVDQLIFPCVHIHRYPLQLSTKRIWNTTMCLHSRSRKGPLHAQKESKCENKYHGEKRRRKTCFQNNSLFILGIR